MAESSRRKVGHLIKEDRISELPRNVQETILCFMPMADAVRTSVLSKKWRHCWTMMPHLIFDEKCVDRIMRKLGEDDDEKLNAYKIGSGINKIILLHKGPILKFSLNIPRYHCDGHIVHDYIDQWIPLLSSKGTKELNLEDSVFEHQIITAHNFSSLDLTHLRLLSVCFPHKPTFGRFTYLTKLKLVFATSSFTQKSQNIFDCPVLERLTLIHCDGLYHTNFRAPNLNCLQQIFQEAESEIPYTGLENLTECSFMLSEIGTLKEAKTSNLVKYLSSLHKIEKFSIGREFLKYLAKGGCPNRLSKPLLFLKMLNISDIHFTHLSEVSCLLCMVRSAPNLSKLYISAENCYGADCDYEDCYYENNLENYRIKDSEDCTTISHLQIVSFRYFRGLKAELELVKFVLAHSPLLKTMFIHRDQSIESVVALTMTEEILQYPRASTIAQIKHLKHSVVIDDFDYELQYEYGI